LAPDKIVVLGIGNVLAGDDGFGPHVVHHLTTRYAIDDPRVEIVDGGTPGFDLYSWLEDVARLIVVDAVARDESAGTLVRLTGKEILSAPPPPRVSPHQPGLREALLALRLSGGEPPAVEMLGVVGASFELGPALSDEVAAAVPECAQRIVETLRSEGVEVRERDEEASPPWWSAD
jgi:hydrogenase maturation protease